MRNGVRSRDCELQRHRRALGRCLAATAPHSPLLRSSRLALITDRLQRGIPIKSSRHIVTLSQGSTLASYHGQNTDEGAEQSGLCSINSSEQSEHGAQ